MRILEGGGENVVKYLRSGNILTGGQNLISSLEPPSARSLFFEASTTELEFIGYCKMCFGQRFESYTTVKFDQIFHFSQTFSHFLGLVLMMPPPTCVILWPVSV